MKMLTDDELKKLREWYAAKEKVANEVLRSFDVEDPADNTPAAILAIIDTALARSARDYFQKSIEDPEFRKLFAQEWMNEDNIRLRAELAKAEQANTELKAMYDEDPMRCAHGQPHCERCSNNWSKEKREPLAGRDEARDELAKVEAERDALERAANARQVAAVKMAQALAMEEAARLAKEELAKLFKHNVGRALAERIRALAPLPPTLKAVPVEALEKAKDALRRKRPVWDNGKDMRDSEAEETSFESDRRAALAALEGA